MGSAGVSIKDLVSRDELLCQLAEEAAELAQAALKLRRAEGAANNPTPVSAPEAKGDLLAEVADVLVCLTELDISVDSNVIWDVRRAKVERWLARLGHPTPKTTDWSELWIVED